MPRYRAIWLEIAREQYTNLPAEIQRQSDTRVEELLENPRQSRSDYDARTDQWATTYGGGAGLVVYAVVHERATLIILRLV
ncbi:MAG: hypothetical protein ACRDSL_05575 [Pseudonocardiaceae bacterium]